MRPQIDSQSLSSVRANIIVTSRESYSTSLSAVPLNAVGVFSGTKTALVGGNDELGKRKVLSIRPTAVGTLKSTYSKRIYLNYKWYMLEIVICYHHIQICRLGVGYSQVTPSSPFSSTKRREQGPVERQASVCLKSWLIDCAAQACQLYRQEVYL